MQSNNKDKSLLNNSYSLLDKIYFYVALQYFKKDANTVMLSDSVSNNDTYL